MAAPRSIVRIRQLDRLTDGRLVAILTATRDGAAWRAAARIEAELGLECSPETVRRWRDALDRELDAQ